MAIPLTVAQLINILYNIVDRMYLGRLPGHLALAGLGLCLPIISIVIGFANLCGTGGAPLCSISRGKGDDAEAEAVMGNSFTLLLICGTVLTVVVLAFQTPLLYLFGTSEDTFPYARDYLSTYVLGTLFVMIGLGMNPFINAQGFGRMGMCTVILGAVVNLILDPIFIFTLDLGVQGAALASVIAQGCSAAWVLYFLNSKKAILRLHRKAMVLQFGRVKRILALGMSNFTMALTNCLVQIVCNNVLQQYGGDLYVSLMTVVNSIREVFTMPVTGMNGGTQPVIGYNYGAKEYGRVCHAIRFSCMVTVGYSAIAWILTLTAPGLLIQLFSDESALLEVGVPAIRMYFATFIFMAFMFASQSVFVGLGRSKTATFFSLLRKAVIVAPLTVLLPAWGFGTDGVFLAEPISNVTCGVACSLIMYLTVYKPMKQMATAHR